MKKYLLFGFFIFINQNIFAQIENEDNPRERIEHEISITVDPKLGRVPYERLIQEREKLHKGIKDNTITAVISGLTWYERGPNNVGGRTRALMFDPNDATKKRVWAGGVGGGLWYNNDITSAASSWTKIDDFWANIAVTCINYDPSNTQVMYVGTGEGWFNGDALQGAGVYKTINGGTTWSLIASTTTGGANENAFKFTQKIIVNSFGEVFAATQSGVLKSTNGGTSWTTSLLASSFNAGSTNFAADLEIGTDGVIYAAFGGGNRGGSRIFKSVDRGVSWTQITPDAAQERTEIALAPSTSGANQVIYAMAQKAATYETAWIKKSIDAGATWVNVTNPDLTSNQAWYDMILAVHPTNPNLVIGGGNVIGRTIDGGTTWVKQSYGIPHPDQHAIVFRPTANNEVIIGNDGGIVYSSDYGDAADTSPIFSVRNTGYNITQYYGIAIKNVASDGYVLGGTQDNNSLKITSAENVVGVGTSVWGGDGILSFIDQNEPTIGLVTAQYGNYQYLNTTTNAVVDLGVASTQFVTTADYDSQNNIFYSDSNNGVNIWKVRNVGGAFTSTTYATGTSNTSFIRAGTTQHTIFLGTNNFQVHKIVNFGEAGQVRTVIGTFPAGSVSSISIGASENELLVTLSNYGIKSVYYTNNGGTTWISKDEAGYGLPDVPVRYGIFNPLDRKQVLLATELGVWSTTDITASNPGWGITSTGLANVSCYQMVVRSADNTVAVATHGRGAYTAKFVSCPSNVLRTGSETVSETILSGTYINGKTANVIQSGVNKVYSAKSYILLEPKFEAVSGSIFRALISGCN